METCPRYPNDNHYPDLPSSASASWEDESRLFASERDVLPIMPGGYNQIPASLLTTAPPIATLNTERDFKPMTLDGSINAVGSSLSAGAAGDGSPIACDFVKKLYMMLEEGAYHSVVSWGPQGDCFVVQDMKEFTNIILPRMFKHSNFASFVRQLNKYDFHKVRSTDDHPFSDSSCAFRHPDFHAAQPEALENIKRKITVSRETVAAHLQNNNPPLQPNSTGDSLGAVASAYQLGAQAARIDSMQRELISLGLAHEKIQNHVHDLERNQQSAFAEMAGFQRNMSQHEGLLQNFIQRSGNGKLQEFLSEANNSSENPSLPILESNQFLNDSMVRANPSQLSEISRGVERGGMPFWSSAAELGPSSSPLDRLPGSLGGGLNDTQSRLDSMAHIAFEMPLQSSVHSPQSQPFQFHPQNLGYGEHSGFASSSARDEPILQGTGMAAKSGSREGSEEREEYVMPTIIGIPTSDAFASALDQASTSSTSEGSSPHEVPSPFPSNSWYWPGLEDDIHSQLEVYNREHFIPRNQEVAAWDFNQGMIGSSNRVFTDARKAAVTFSSPSSSAFPKVSDWPSSSTLSSPVSTLTSTGTRNVQRFFPGWAVPPRVLLVDDDAVSRMLGRKFLEIIGCSTDLAVDGVGAVHMMNLEKYDLVLMDIMMPKLDGVSATSLIRKFDHMTPIISMTSNSTPNEIMTYYSSGMNDILTKPFTKQGLLDLLEKHLIHLKVLQQISRAPRPAGIPPPSDAAIKEALATQAALMVFLSPSPAISDALAMANSSMLPEFAVGANDERLNPLAGLVLPDEQYDAFVRSILDGEIFMSGTGVKRSLEDSDDGKTGKRSRFEVVE